VVFLCLLAAASATVTNESPAAFTAWLSAAPGVTTSAIGACVIQYSASDMMLGVVCHHNISSSDAVLYAHIHGPTSDPVTGNVNPLITLNVAGQGNNSVSLNAAVTSSQLCNMFQGECYINVHTASQTNGLIRGPVVPTGGSSGYTHTAILDNVQAGNGGSITDSGIGLVKRSGASIWVDLFHSLTVAPHIGEHIHTDIGGGIIYSICGLQSAKYPNCTSLADPKDVVNMNFLEGNSTALDDGIYYFNVHTAKYNGGQIRGQIAMGSPITNLVCSGCLAQASFGLIALLAFFAMLFQ